MKKILMIALSTGLLVACGSNKSEEEVVVLESHKDRLSYSVGSMQGREFLRNADDNFKKLKYDLIIKGYEQNLNSGDSGDCQDVLRDLFGQYGEMDTTKIDEASVCLGRLAASSFYREMEALNILDKFDTKKLAIGFKHGLYERDTLIKEDNKIQLVQEFFNDISQKQQAELAKLDSPFLENAKKLPNAREIDGGIIIETIKAGTGGSPSMTDDVEAHYILTNTKGDTMESSKTIGKPLAINLQSVIAGWSMSFPQLKKGGIYRLYIPSNLAYQQGALCFYIEFLNYGAAGTLAPMPKPQF